MIKHASLDNNAKPLSDLDRETKAFAYCLDNPTTQHLIVPYFDTLRIEGWAASPYKVPLKLAYRLAGGQWQEQMANISRPDVQEYFAGLSKQFIVNTGFSFTVDLPDIEAKKQVIELIFTDGYCQSELECFVIEKLQSPSYSTIKYNNKLEPEHAWHTISSIKEIAPLTLATLQRTVGVNAEDVLLEFGCGNACLGVEVASQCAQWIGAGVVGPVFEHARQAYADIDNMQFHLVNNWDLDGIESASVDLVYSTGVFASLSEWDRFSIICEARRVLKPQGRLLIDGYNLISEAGWKMFVDIMSQYHPANRPSSLAMAATGGELLTYFKRAGFEQVEYEEQGMWLFVWAKG